MAKLFKKEDIITQLAEVVGQEKAANLVSEALAESAVGIKLEYDQKEMMKICDALKKKDQVTRIIAGCIASQAMLMNIQ